MSVGVPAGDVPLKAQTLEAFVLSQGGVAEAQRICHQRAGHGGYKFVEGCVSGAEQVDSQPVECCFQRIAMDVLTWARPWEHVVALIDRSCHRRCAVL